MKSDVNKKILRLLSTEVLLQIGFEKGTEHAMNILAEVVEYYLVSLIKKVLPFKDSNSEVTNKFLIEDTYFSEKFQAKELSNFLDQQIFIKKQLKDKFEIECDESLLHSLRILPKGISLKSVFKNTKTMTLEEKKSMEVYQEIQLDEFMNDIIDKSRERMNKREIGSYEFDCSKIIEKIDVKGTGEHQIPFERINTEPKDSIFGYIDDILAEQESMIDDFKGTERYQTTR